MRQEHIARNNSVENAWFVRRDYYLSLIITFVLGTIAYGYTLIVDTPTHDGIMQVTKDQMWMLQLGRWMVKYYILLRGTMNAPIFIGVISFLYIGTAVYFLFRLLEIEFNPMYLSIVAGVFLGASSTMSLATVYTYIMDINSLAFLFSVLSVFLLVKWEVPYYFRIPVGMMTLAMSMGLYQSYFSVTVSLFILVLIRAICNSDVSTFDVIKQGIAFIFFLFGSGGLYWIALHILLEVNDTELWTGSYNSVTNLFATSLIIKLKQIPYSYLHLFKYLCTSYSPIKSHLHIVASCFIILMGIFLWGKVIIQVEGISKKILLGIMLLVFPLCVNSIYVLSNAKVHSLMTASYQFIYIICFLPIITNTIGGEKGGKKLVYVKKICEISIAILLFTAIQFSNGVAHYQRLVGVGTQALVTNMIYDIEREPNYSDKLLIIGNVSSIGGEYVLSEKFGSLSGTSGNGITFSYNDYFVNYIYYMHGKKYGIETNNDIIEKFKKTKIVQDMPVYPTRGYCKVIDGYTVLKLEEIQE
ncbi:glucosyltransferase domain-containing protein [Butyrivibrio proteoclasticus]|uniref:glucosyltransferase domain-containing protein n=1 Tax=Butyrivibrio proteoclasticus TaxID=43305 RepID=UPI00047E6903|nr:glucosyltransferase domain-containing protein [Butyrivibrio proteoclasticus]